MKESVVQDNPINKSDVEMVDALKRSYDRLKEEIHKVIVGQDDVLDQILMCIFARGHALLVGVPGLAKTLMIRSLSDCLSLSFNRIQFTPDLMPADITGTEVIQEEKGSGTRSFRFLQGPIFANIILADEINRTPPKTQAALLESMQEYQVTAGGRKHSLELPFFVLATQNPIEQEGTYPLPEAQQDRFMFNIMVDYPSQEEELQVMRFTTADRKAQLEKVIDANAILELQEIVRKVPVSEHVMRYAMNITRATRVTTPEALDFVKEWVAWGAGPRATQFLILGAKANAVLSGRYHVSADDVRKVAHPVLRHRIITNFTAEAEGITSDKIIDRLIETIPSHESGAFMDSRLPKLT
ncbi:MAG: MoxR family ATPase [Planctomycetes bacterium]|nr:MoxR family ATPase [Planctomycetota bacterium]